MTCRTWILIEATWCRINCFGFQRRCWLVYSLRASQHRNTPRRVKIVVFWTNWYNWGEMVIYRKKSTAPKFLSSYPASPTEHGVFTWKRFHRSRPLIVFSGWSKGGQLTQSRTLLGSCAGMEWGTKLKLCLVTVQKEVGHNRGGPMAPPSLAGQELDIPPASSKRKNVPPTYHASLYLCTNIDLTEEPSYTLWMAVVLFCRTWRNLLFSIHDSGSSRFVSLILILVPRGTHTDQLPCAWGGWRLVPTLWMDASVSGRGHHIQRMRTRDRHSVRVEFSAKGFQYVHVPSASHRVKPIRCFLFASGHTTVGPRARNLVANSHVLVAI